MTPFRRARLRHGALPRSRERVWLRQPTNPHPPSIGSDTSPEWTVDRIPARGRFGALRAPWSRPGPARRRQPAPRSREAAASREACRGILMDWARLRYDPVRRDPMNVVTPLAFLVLLAPSRLAYDPPKDWKPVEATSSMRLAQWSYGSKSEIVVFYFGEGQGGSVEANLDRWYGQFEQPDGSSTRERAKVSKSKSGAL